MDKKQSKSKYKILLQTHELSARVKKIEGQVGKVRVYVKETGTNEVSLGEVAVNRNTNDKMPPKGEVRVSSGAKPECRKGY